MNKTFLQLRGNLEKLFKHISKALVCVFVLFVFNLGKDMNKALPVKLTLIQCH